MKLNKVYWLYYSTLDFDAHIVKSVACPDGNEILWRGPFKTLTEVRQYGKKLIDHDIAEFKGMKRVILKSEPVDEENY